MNKKIIIISLILAILTLNIYTTESKIDIQKADELYHDGEYQKAYDLLKQALNDPTLNLAVLWRIDRALYEIIDALPNKEKQEKIAKFTEAMDLLKPYLNITNGDKYDRANIVYWYTVCFAARGQVIGIKESLDIIPSLFELSNKSISIDPSLSGPYFLMAEIDKAVPSFLGGDKFRMGINYSQAIKCEPEDMTILVDSADGFLTRGWDIDKKKKMTDKKNMEDGTPKELSDKDYAKQLLQKATDVYKGLQNPSARDKQKHDKAVSLLKKLEK